MKLRSLRLSLANVARTTNSKTLEVTNAGKTMKRDASGNLTNELDYPYVECSVYRGDTLKIKFPVELADKVDDLRKKIEDNDVIIEISFDKLKLIPYALKSQTGTVLSGVSAKADDFTIVSEALEELQEIDL